MMYDLFRHNFTKSKKNLSDSKNTNYRGRCWVLHYFTFTFYTCIIPTGFLPWEIGLAFAGESQLRQSRAIPPPLRSGELRTQRLKAHLVRTWSLNVLSLKHWVGQYIVIHATLTARNFFLAYFYPSSPFTCIFSQNLSRFFPALAVANTGSCVGPQNEISHPAVVDWAQSTN